MVLKQLVVFADSDVSLRLETVADQAAISSNTVSPAPLRIRRSTIFSFWVQDNSFSGTKTRNHMENDNHVSSLYLCFPKG